MAMMYSHRLRATTAYNGGQKYLSLSDISFRRHRQSTVVSPVATRSKSAAARRDDSLSKRIQSSLSTSSLSSTNYSKGSTKQSSQDTKNSSNNIKNNKKEQNVADWRAWFSSTEYDDPWSPYRPLPSTQLQQHSSNTNNSQNVVNTIITNYNDWERRRHGMNLVPLSFLHLNDNDVSHQFDSADIHHHHNNNNTTQLHHLQKRTQWIDTQTRFTIQMLHDLHDSGIRRQMDRPTVERCHRMIGRLLSLTPRDGNVFTIVKDGGGGDETNSIGVGDGRSGTVGNGGGRNDESEQEVTVQITGAAQRGNAILERMEKCSPAILPQLRIWQRQQQQRQWRKQGSDGGGFDFSSLEQPAIESASSVIDFHAAKVPKHLLKTKQAIPTPTRAIYNMVLLLYAKEAGSRYVAEQAEDVVWGMIVRGLQLEEFHKSHEDDIDEGTKIDNEEMSTPLFPNTQNWNCVLQSWSNSTDPNRAFFAYSFFKSWMEWNESRGGEVDESCDLQSFHWMLRACVVDEFTVLDDEGEGNTSATSEKLLLQRAKEIGSRVAIGIWRDMRTWRNENNQVTLTSDTYEHLLRALGQTTDRSRGLLAAVAAVFQSCRNDGMETKEITELVRGVMTESQFQKMLRNERTSATSSKS